MAKKTKKADITSDVQPEAIEPQLEATPETEVPAEIPAPEIKDPIGDVTDGEAEVSPDAEIETDEAAEAETETEIEAEDGPEPEEDEPVYDPKPRLPAKLERLQKILSQAGVSSRRKAEEMIEQGRVQVNGKVVTELGTKADSGRDHIRVDGKLLQGAERLRYFMLNKPKGFVTTVKDPEGRPTVMQFFEKMRERLYPVGRLDYMSEGLLLMSNDGDLANKLTKAASGVEKTYLVKVAGQPTEDELDLLRSGVAIERGKPGSAKVRTSPARIRQVRQGDNPWYEVVLIEGRNRELRKMFEQVGHFVEKIRRVGYGPLVLDLEPGNLRELDPQELELLQQTAEGKMRTPKSKEMRRRNALDAAGLPTVTPRPTIHPRPAKPFAPKTFDKDSASKGGSGEYKPKRAFGGDKPFRPARPASEGFRPAADRPAGPAKFGAGRPTDRPASRPAWKKDEGAARPPARFAAGSVGEARPSAAKPYGAKPATPRTYGSKPAAGRTFGDKPAGRTYGDKPASGKPAWNKTGSSDRPAFNRPAAPRPAAAHTDDFEDRKPIRLRIDAVGPERSGPERSSTERPRPQRSYSSDRSPASRPGIGRSSAPRPPREEGGLARPYTTSSGKPRAGGARPSSKPGRPAGKSYSSAPSARPDFGDRSSAPSRSIDPRTGSGYRPAAGPKRSFDGPRSTTGSARPYTPRAEGASESRPRSSSKPYPDSASRAERKAGASWKPKKPFGAGKPAGGGYSKPKPGGFSKSGFKGKPSGSRSGGKKRG